MIGPYSIQRLINQGGQGQVYLGYDRRLHRQVAIKIHPLPAVRRERRRALEEARRVAAIQSPRVVQIYDVIQSSDYLAMVMEYVPGCDLEELLGNAQLSLASVITVATDLAVALAASRQQGLVHGDIKAANLLITRQGRVKLVDFGIARAAGGDALPAGSLAALAPEQLSGRPLDIRTDLFAMGRLLYRMLTGEHSFSRAGAPDSRLLLAGEQASVTAATQAAMEVPPALTALVDQLLQPDPERRPRNTHQVRRVLRDVAKQLPLSSADSLLREAQPFFRRESPADIPPQIPHQLARHGRSSHTRGWPGTGERPLASRLAALALGTLSLLALAIPLLAAWQGRSTLVWFEEPVVEVLAGPAPPLSAAAMLAVVRETIAGQDPGARFGGAARDRAIHTGDQDSVADERIVFELRCDRLACLLMLRREGPDDGRFHQVLLAREQGADYWRSQVGDATAALYP